MEKDLFHIVDDVKKTKGSNQELQERRYLVFGDQTIFQVVTTLIGTIYEVNESRNIVYHANDDWDKKFEVVIIVNSLSLLAILSSNY